jgi:hypothetical protein
MQAFAENVRYIHVLFGAIGLAAFWVPVFTRKGAANHVRFGKIFVWSAYVVLGGAAVSLATRFIFMVQNQISPSDQPSQFAFLIFLGYLTLVTFVSVRHGITVVLNKRDPAALNTWLNSTMAWLAIAASIGIIGYALLISPPNMILLLALSPIGLGIGYGNLRYMRSTPPSKRQWMYEHLGAMIGSGIAFHTAFAVFGSSRLFDIGLDGWIAIIPWVAPAAIGIPAITLWTRHYRRKFGELA